MSEIWRKQEKNGDTLWCVRKPPCARGWVLDEEPPYRVWDYLKDSEQNIGDPWGVIRWDAGGYTFNERRY